MLSKFSVKKPYTVVVGIVLIIILGIVSFRDMTVDLLPSMNLPYAIVMTTYPGASPEEVEEIVTKPVEQTMATVSNIKNIQSVSSENASTVMLEFEQTANMDSVTIEMRENLDQISGFWPEEIASPMIMKLNPDMLPVLVTAVSAKGKDAVEASRIIEDKVIPEVESVEGVASVMATGNITETVEVTLNKEKIDGLSDDIQEEMQAQLAVFIESEKAIAVQAAEKAQALLEDVRAAYPDEAASRRFLDFERRLKTLLSPPSQGESEEDEAENSLSEEEFSPCELHSGLAFSASETSEKAGEEWELKEVLETLGLCDD